MREQPLPVGRLTVQRQGQADESVQDESGWARWTAWATPMPSATRNAFPTVTGQCVNLTGGALGLDQNEDPEGPLRYRPSSCSRCLVLARASPFVTSGRPGPGRQCAPAVGRSLHNLPRAAASSGGMIMMTFPPPRSVGPVPPRDTRHALDD